MTRGKAAGVEALRALRESELLQAADKEVIERVRAQVLAARAKMELDRESGRETPDAVRKIAEARSR